MWLLSTDRAEFRYFSGPEAVPGGYAILSHVWDDREQTFQDIKKVHEFCTRSGGNPRNFTSVKIEQTCIVAQRKGHKWIWIDTCCIDKSSSAELSEAINSMFQYYSRAAVCYVYLKDVPSGHNLYSANSAFRRSRWHTRGWTLQELIAPGSERLVFVSADWTILGTKGELAPLVEEITHISAAVQRHTVPLSSVSIAKRMSWAATRQTMRVEDEAYCLVGIFGINLPTVYGEGRRHAFRRLQEEIMKQTEDPSLFVWGAVTTPQALQSAVRWCDGGRVHTEADSFLFAPAPSAFQDIGDILYDPPRTVEPQMSARRGQSTVVTALTKVPTFSITTYGVHAHVPVVEISGLVVAVLFCTKATQQAIGLILTPCPTSSELSRPLYHTGAHFNEASPRRFRTCMLNLSFHSPAFAGLKSSWKDVYITHLPPPPANIVPAILKQMVTGGSWVPFRFTRWDIRHLQERGFHLDSNLTRADGWDNPDSRATTALVFKRESASTGRVFYMELLLGRCTTTGAHWATIRFHAAIPPDVTRSSVHSCREDHAGEWPHGTRTFHHPTSRANDGWCGTITLSLTPCPANPRGTRVVKLVLMDARV